jgi:predicted glutamine amidotransferase
MCRLFGMSGGRRHVAATFWLLQAPDSLAQQSRREPDGTGLGSFDERDHAVVSKQPLAAYEDRKFATEAHEVRSHTFVGESQEHPPVRAGRPPLRPQRRDR